MRSTEHERVGERGVGSDKKAERWLAGRGASPDAGPSARERKRLWAYRRAALSHPSNLIAMALVLLLGLIHPSVGVLLSGLGAEVLFVVFGAKSGWLRRFLDESIAEAEDAAKERAREALVAQMSDGHRDEFARLDGLIRRIDECEAGRAPRLEAAEGLDMHNLSASYIRLALAHKACEEALYLPEQRSIKVSVRALEAAQQAASERVRAAIGERIAATQRRTAFEARLREDIEVISHQLAAIVEIIQLRHQETISLGPCAEADRFRQELDEARTAVREVAEIDAPASLPVSTIACA